MIKRSLALALLACSSVMLSQPSIGASPEERVPSALEQLTQTLLGESGAAVAEEIEIEGTLEVLVEDRHDGSRVLNFLDSDSGERHELFFVSRPPDLLSGARVRVKGLRIGDAIAIESGAKDVERIHARSALSTLATAVLPNTFGVQKTVVILVNFSNDTSELYTIEQARTGYAAADDWYRKASYQQTSLAVDVFGWFTLPLSNTSCDTNQIRLSAQAKAAAAGVDLSSYLHQVYAFPFNSNCLFAGLASVGGNPSSAWINGRTDTGIIAHELGHNEGLYHSHILRCQPNVLTGTCSVGEYGDVTDAMGTGFGYFNAFQKQRLGWLDYGVSPPTTHVGASGTYSIDAYEGMGANPKALKIPRGTTGQSFFVELRRNVDWDQYMYRSGVFVHMAADTDPNSSVLLDMVPSTVDFSTDAFLDVGKTFTDPVSGVSITTTSISAIAASISVSMTGGPPPTCTHVSPAVGVTSSATGGVSAGTKVTYTIAVTNKDVSPCTASTFNLGASAPSGWTLLWGATSLSIAPGASASTTLSITSPAAAASATYTVSGSATNATAPSATAPFSATYVVSGSGGPTGGTGTFSDNFDRADNTNLGTAWTEISGDLVLKGNALKNAPGVASHKAVVSSLSGATQTVSADFMSPNNNQGPVLGLILRYQNPTNYYMAYRQVGGSAVLRIAKVVNGATTILATVSQANPAVNVPFKLTARVSGAAISLDLNGVNRLNVNDTAFPSGKAGILINSSSTTTQYQADNFTASVQ